jgi:tetratricopeptide (TPR) repeat protein
VINYTKESQHPQYGKIRDRNLDKGDFVFALGGDVYEQPAEPKVVEEFDFGDIEKKRKKLQEEREVKTEWSKWQKKFDAAYDKALKYDKDTDLKAGDKAKVWKRLANSFSQDNPYSTEDQLIRSKAVERMEYWRNYREPTPPVSIRQEPSYGDASLTKKTDDAEAHFNLGYAYHDSGKYKEAIESYKQAIRIDPDYAEAHNGLGFAYGESGKHQEAIESFKQAVKIDPDNAFAHAGLGVAYGELDKYEEAIEAYKQAIRIYPDYADAHNNLGEAYYWLDKHQEAIESCKQAIRIDPDYVYAHFNLGRASLALNDRDSALEQYEILKSLDPELANLLFNDINEKASLNYIEGHYEYVKKRKWVDTSTTGRVWVKERIEGDRRIEGHYEDRNVLSGYWQEYEEKVWIPAHYE